LKGADPNNVEISEAKKQIEANMKNEDMDWDDQSDDADDMPIFTSELAALKQKELGDPNMEDDDMEEDEDLKGIVPNND
jgi:hypothetical protein